jgi:hypothetical protein
MVVHEDDDINIEWNPAPIKHYLTHICTFFTMVGLFPLIIILFLISFNLIIYFILIVWFSITLIITLQLIMIVNHEIWRFQRKAFKAPPAILVNKIEHLLNSEKIKYNKKIIKSKITKGFERISFLLGGQPLRIVLRTSNQFIHIGPITNQNQTYVNQLKEKIDEKLSNYLY